MSMVAFAISPENAAFYIHLSRLAHHTQAILRDPRVGLLVAETDDGGGDPQTLARASISGDAVEMSETDADHDDARSRYLDRFPQARTTFALGDFSLFRIKPTGVRFVAGFGKIYSLRGEDLWAAAREDG